MRNSSLVDRDFAPIIIGAKSTTEAADCPIFRDEAVVGECSVVGRSQTVRTGGRTRSNYAGMSSENHGEKP